MIRIILNICPAKDHKYAIKYTPFKQKLITITVNWWELNETVRTYT